MNVTIEIYRNLYKNAKDCTCNNEFQQFEIIINAFHTLEMNTNAFQRFDL